MYQLSLSIVTSLHSRNAVSMRVITCFPVSKLSFVLPEMKPCSFAWCHRGCSHRFPWTLGKFLVWTLNRCIPPLRKSLMSMCSSRDKLYEVMRVLLEAVHVSAPLWFERKKTIKLNVFQTEARTLIEFRSIERRGFVGFLSWFPEGLEKV